MNISIIGVGCVGSVIAERIFQTEEKNNLRIIATGERAKNFELNGVTVNGRKMMIPVQKKSDPKADVCFVCVKNFDLEQALQDAIPFIDDNTIFFPLLNSISPTPSIKEKYPNNSVLYGYITRIDAYNDNGEYRYNIAGEVHFGYANNKIIDPKLQEIKNLLVIAGFEAIIDEDMVRGVWKKWMLNVGANQVSALTEADYLKFAQISEIENVLKLAMQELLTIACYEKVNLSTLDILEIIEYLTTYPYPKQTSMLQDIIAHRKTEIEYISGDILKLAQKWNCPCPVNLTMYYLIKSKEKVYLLENDII